MSHSVENAPSGFKKKESKRKLKAFLSLLFPRESQHLLTPSSKDFFLCVRRIYSFGVRFGDDKLNPAPRKESSYLDYALEARTLNDARNSNLSYPI